MRECANPACHDPASRKGVCAACRKYQLAHDGADRPWEQIRKSKLRQFMITERRRRERRLRTLGLVEQFADPKLEKVIGYRRRAS